MNGNGIGLLQESSLHAALKAWYAQRGDELEVRVDGSIVDIVRGRLLIEIQTSNFAALKRKIAKLTVHHRMRLVYPITQEKWIIKLDDGLRTQISRRKSPKRGRAEDVFTELVSIASFVARRNFSLELVFIREEEVWSRAHRNHQRPSWRRGGWARHDRRLLEVLDTRLFQSPADYRVLLPATDGQVFTSSDLAATRGVSRSQARRITYCLRHIGVITAHGQRGREVAYLESPQPPHRTSKPTNSA